MAIFKCTGCDDIFDLSEQIDLDGLVFCGCCHGEHINKLKPKITSHKYHDKDYDEPLKQRKK